MAIAEIKAIETKYRGCRFRSRLEARWAVFLDAIGIKWQYEPEGYSLPSGKYLPDFFLPDLGFWLEIKPSSDVGYAPLKVYLAGPMDMLDRAKWRFGERNVSLTGPIPDSRGKHGVVFHGAKTESVCDREASFILHECLRQIDKADEVWAFIPDVNRYGTVAEIGYAKARGKTIRLALGRNAMLPHPKAEMVGRTDTQHGVLQSHEMWFIESMSDSCMLDVDCLDDALDCWQPRLKRSDALCAELSAHTGRWTWLARGCPGDDDSHITVFTPFGAYYRGWPWPITNGNVSFDEAARMARSARFEFGEQG